LDIAVLLDNLYRATQHPEIGYADADTTMRELINATLVPVELPREVVEKLLYYSNLMSEEQGFWHYEDISFDQFCSKLAIKHDGIYNWISDK
jgi:hypothetical protein